MPFRFLDDVAIADVAYEAEGATLTELFESAALALLSIMVVDADKLEQDANRHFEIEAESLEMLLFNFLQELIFLKDSELLFLCRFHLKINRSGSHWTLVVDANETEIDPERHDLLADVKAVSLHHYLVEETAEGWRADVIVDV